jgi:hypothetical protein
MRKSKVLVFSLMALAVLLFSISVSAQKKLSGVVLDATSGTPLNGATISIKNGNATALSRNDGKFDINTEIACSFYNSLQQPNPLGHLIAILYFYAVWIYG